MRPRIVVLSASMALASQVFTFPLRGEEPREKRQEKQEKPEQQEKPEDRLLQAELLEVSTGDLEKAMAVYRAIQADEKAPEATRARALLYLARCQRKLGELDQARKTLEDLVKDPAQEREILRQARSFLRELQGGRAENPSFDWLKELEKSPEIQARVFDLAMDLASPDAARNENGARQLRALGSLAVPVVEHVLEVSRDASHRWRLAMTLVYCGRYDRLDALLDNTIPPITFQTDTFLELVAAIRSFTDESRRQLIAALDKLPGDPATELPRSLLYLHAGDARDLPRRLRSLEARPMTQKFQETLPALLGRLAAESPGAAQAMLERILDPDGPLEVLDRYVGALHDHAPGKLTPEHWGAYLERLAVELKAPPGSPHGAPPSDMRVSFWLETLDKEEGYGAFQRLASGPLAESVGGYFWNHYVFTNPGTQRNIRAASGRWPGILRAVRPRKALHLLAEVNDAAVPELVDFLRNRAKEDPEYVGCNMESSHCGHWGAVRGEDWTPSTAYRAAMASLLDEKDPVTLAIAVEALALAPEMNPPGTVARIETLAKEAEDGHVRELALYALLASFAKDPTTGPAAAGALFRELQARSEAKETPEGYLKSPLAGVMDLGSVSRVKGGPSSIRVTPAQRPSRRALMPPASTRAPEKDPTPFVETIAWILDRTENYVRLALYPHVLDLADSAAGAQFHEWFWPRLGFFSQNDALWALAPLSEKLTSVQSPELMASIVSKLWDTGGPIKRDSREQISAPPKAVSKILAFLKKAAAESRLPLKTRLQACYWAGEECFAWFDWPRLFRGEDPLAAHLLAGTLPGEEGLNAPIRKRFWEWIASLPDARQAELFEAGLASPQEDVRLWALSKYGRPDLPDVLRKALKDPSSNVKQTALDKIKSSSRADVGPVVLELLSHPEQGMRSVAVDKVGQFASPEAIEPLTKMLDDPDVLVRQQALAALRKVRAALDEKKEWQDLVEKLKESKTPVKKAP